MSLTNLRIANYLELETTCNMERVREFQYVYLIVFTKELKRRPIFVSKKAIAPVREKPILRAKPITPVFVSVPETREAIYTVLKVWDNGSSYRGDHVHSVLIIERGSRRAPFWASVFEKQCIDRGDVLRKSDNGRLVKVQGADELEHSIYLGASR
ncbi:hypothetical protein [Pleurocapsa sp. FMAR1]|uniref:hypothetical protein n=1 Tax=Pleurocapsa sp. FMAR1 TaxID=3040204 RepID=UPI0029C6226B|nr:hypothetical protein [Pleurocapsa sp. FMAR1]